MMRRLHLSSSRRSIIRTRKGDDASDAVPLAAATSTSWDSSHDQDDHVKKESQSQTKRYHVDDEEVKDAYRVVFAVLTAMAVVLFTINMLQVCMLDRITHWAWLIVLPGIIFLLFLVAAVAYVLGRRAMFFGLEIPDQTDRDDENSEKEKGGTGEEIEEKPKQCRVFASSPAASYQLTSHKGPKHTIRLGNMANIIIKVILVEFIYLNTLAVPAYKTITWDMGLNSASTVPAPSLALWSNVHLRRRASLEMNETRLDELCENKQTKSKQYGDQRCFEDPQSYDSTKLHQNIDYVVVDGSTIHDMMITDSIDVWYAYNYNGTASNQPYLAVSVFDTKLLPHFTTAFDCGIITPILFPARGRNTLSIQPYYIDDQLNAMERTPECNIPAFWQYTGYNAQVTPLAMGVDLSPDHCDVSKTNYNGSCSSDIDAVFSSLLGITRRSKHSKDWRTILPEEGGIFGLVTFVTWFTTLYAI